MKACSTAANMKPLKINSDLCFFYSLSFWDLFQLNGCQCSQYYWLLEPRVALTNKLCLTLSSVCFEVVLAEGGTGDCRKSPFFLQAIAGLYIFWCWKQIRKEEGRQVPQSPSVRLLCSHPQDRLSVKINSHLRCCSFSTRASRICRVLAEAC